MISKIQLIKQQKAFDLLKAGFHMIAAENMLSDPYGSDHMETLAKLRFRDGVVG